jgi:uncharacterized protein YjiS (DUF1127 family)
VSADNRLTAEQLAALAPGDAVVIETSGDFRRPQLCTATVTRIDPRHVVVSERTAHGGRYVHRFRLRDGIRDGGGRHAQLIDAGQAEQVAMQRRSTAAIDAAYRAWARNRRDVDALRALQDAIAEQLAAVGR